MTFYVTDKPVSEWEKKSYIQSDVGIYKTVRQGDSYTKAGLKYGTEVNFGNKMKFNANLGFGTDISLNAELSKKFNIDEKKEIEIYGSADYYKRIVGEPKYVEKSKSIDSVESESKYSNSSNTNDDNKYRNGYKKASVGMLLNLMSQKGNVGIGFEGGYRTNLLPKDVDLVEIKEHGYTTQSKSNRYITPKLKAIFNLNKDETVSLNANFDMYGADFGIKCLF